MTKLFFWGALVDGQCGIGRLYKCHTVESYNKTYNTKTSESVLEASNKVLPTDRALTKPEHAGGTGLFGTGFIPDQRSKLLYETLCKNHKLVFQTPARMNKNSGNMFFYAMFDDKENNDVAYIKPDWPFKDVN